MCISRPYGRISKCKAILVLLLDIYIKVGTQFARILNFLVYISTKKDKYYSKLRNT